MAEKVSLATHLHLPDAIPVLLFTLGVLLLLAAWLGSADLGIFKLPEMATPSRRAARWLGIGLLILTISLYVPFERSSIPESPARPIEVAQGSALPEEPAAKKVNVALKIPTEIEVIIRHHCEHAWPDDFSMRAYCVRQQREAVIKLQKGKPKEVPEDAFKVMRRKCTSQWPDDFTMREYCEGQQVEGFLETYRGAN